MTGRAAELLEQAEALSEKATLGPWGWGGNLAMRTVDLMSSVVMRPIVMSFGRYGMRGGAPFFNRDGILHRFDTFTKPDYTHRADFSRIDHGDAEFIAAARTLVPELAAWLRLALTVVEAARRFRPLSQELRAALAAFDRAGTDTNNEATE